MPCCGNGAPNGAPTPVGDREELDFPGNLRGQLRCILLVSHQEEFADAFADGYLFELADGSTRVKRFQR